MIAVLRQRMKARARRRAYERAIRAATEHLQRRQSERPLWIPSFDIALAVFRRERAK